MWGVLVLVALVAGISLTLIFGNLPSKTSKKSKKTEEEAKESEKPEEDAREAEEAEGDEGFMDPDVRYYTQEEFEQFVNYTKDENGEVKSELIDMINALPKGEMTPLSFVKLSIFDDLTRGSIREDLDKVESYFTTKGGVELNDLEKRAMGSMLGMAIADSMGHKFEFSPLRYGEIELKDMNKKNKKERWGTFKLKPGQWTDDTSMGLCLADSLLARGGEWDPHDCMHRFLAWWHGGYDNAFRFNDRPRSSCGLGGNVIQFQFHIHLIIISNEYLHLIDFNVIPAVPQIKRALHRRWGQERFRERVDHAPLLCSHSLPRRRGQGPRSSL